MRAESFVTLCVSLTTHYTQHCSLANSISVAIAMAIIYQATTHVHLTNPSTEVHTVGKNERG